MENTEDGDETAAETAATTAEADSPNETTTTIATTVDTEELIEEKPPADAKDSITSTVTLSDIVSVKHVTITEEKDDVPQKQKQNEVEEEEREQDDDMFVNKNLTIFGDSEYPGPNDTSFSDYETSDLVSEEEEENFEIYDFFGDLAIKEHEEEKKQPINRESLLNELQTLQEEKILMRKKNTLLHRKLTEYYKKRKLDQVFQDSFTDLNDNFYEKYERKIQEFYDERDKWLREKAIIDDEVDNMRVTKTLHSEYLNKIMNNLLNREKEVGALLVDPNTGKRVPEKMYNRLIQRQRHKSTEIAEIRLVYIKHRDRVKEVETQLKSLETIDGTLHLMDFEQLRMENTTYTDKIEERDEELMRLRERHSHANSVLAHTREKSNVIVEEIEEKKEDSIRQGYNVSEIREYLNELKVKRDNNRALAEKLNLNSGLLTYPRLLIDMEESLKLEDVLNTQIEELKKTNKIDRNKLIAVRNAIEQTEHTLIKHVNDRRKESNRDKTYYHGRPTIFRPNIAGLVHNPKYDF